MPFLTLSIYAYHTAKVNHKRSNIDLFSCYLKLYNNPTDGWIYLFFFRPATVIFLPVAVNDKKDKMKYLYCLEACTKPRIPIVSLILEHEYRKSIDCLPSNISFVWWILVICYSSERPQLED